MNTAPDPQWTVVSLALDPVHLEAPPRKLAEYFVSDQLLQFSHAVSIYCGINGIRFSTDDDVSADLSAAFAVWKRAASVCLFSIAHANNVVLPVSMTLASGVLNTYNQFKARAGASAALRQTVQQFQLLLALSDRLHCLSKMSEMILLSLRIQPLFDLSQLTTPALFHAFHHILADPASASQMKQFALIGEQAGPVKRLEELVEPARVPGLLLFAGLVDWLLVRFSEEKQSSLSEAEAKVWGEFLATCFFYLQDTVGGHFYARTFPAFTELLNAAYDAKAVVNERLAKQAVVEIVPEFVDLSGTLPYSHVYQFLRKSGRDLRAASSS